MPDRQIMLDDLAWITERIHGFFAEWAQHSVDEAKNASRMEVALYFLRHTQHHLGEFSAAARLLELERPAWQFLKRTPVALIKQQVGDGTATV